MVNEANSPTRGSTPARMEKLIASGISAGHPGLDVVPASLEDSRPVDRTDPARDPLPSGATLT